MRERVVQVATATNWPVVTERHRSCTKSSRLVAGAAGCLDFRGTTRQISSTAQRLPILVCAVCKNTKETAEVGEKLKSVNKSREINRLLQQRKEMRSAQF